LIANYGDFDGGRAGRRDGLAIPGRVGSAHRRWSVCGAHSTRITRVGARSAVVRDLARVGRDLKVRREALGLSLDDAARSSGVERSALAKIERGANPNPTVGTLAKVAHALGGRVAIGFEPFRE
jgi:DNA-binding XRE family transcriptional regulator